MLGITYHNPATISVFLDRMRFRDCFISADELREGEWKRKLKQFVDLPSDGRERVLFVESFAALQTLLQHGAELEAVKVAVYDDCEVLSKVPGASIVDAHINGDQQDTWQLYTVSFGEFNDALASQPSGVPGLLRDYDVKEDADLPEQKRETKQEPEASVEPEKEEPKDSPGKTLVMEQILDDIEADGEEDEEDEAPEWARSEPTKTPEPAVTAMPEPARVVIPKGGGPVEVTPSTAEEIVEAVGVTEEEQEQAREIVEEIAPEPSKPEPDKAKPKRKRSKKPAPPKSFELF